MYFPALQESGRRRDITTVFGGYNHTLSCPEGQFYEMKNISAAHYPILSVRKKRGIAKTFSNFQGMLDKAGILWIDNGKLYINGEEVEGLTISEGQKNMVKIGAYVVISPDNIYYNTSSKEHGHLEATTTIPEGVNITFSMCDASGAAIIWHTNGYYDKYNPPKDGDYLLTKVNGKYILKVYSATTSIWTTVSTTYTQITSVGIGKDFKPQDGIKISLNKKIPELNDIFVNAEENGVSTNTTVVDRTDDSITIPGIIGKVVETSEIILTVERKVPKMSFVTECGNRLWGCSPDGHEIYASKLGDITNWNSFQGLADDSWAATVGSDGEFTGAATYDGFPIFFKEDCILKIGISSSGAHQIKETKCRGVQKGSANSIALLNETMFYKSSLGVCAYNGGSPYDISDVLGDVMYYEAAGGALDDCYYISMRDTSEKYHLFVYDIKNNIWCKEDNTQAFEFCRYQDDLYFVGNDNVMYSVRGTKLDLSELREEDAICWSIESGDIGYSSPDYKYVAKISLHMSLDVGANVDFWIQYNSSGTWEHKFNESGKGSKIFTIPLIPKRCDHFRYKISGKGDCKIHSITKTIEGGSDS